MSIRGDKLWNKVVFYKAYLPPADAARVQKYTILVVSDEPTETPGDCPQRRAPKLSPAALPPSLKNSFFPDTPPLTIADVSPPQDIEARSVGSDFASVTPSGHRNDRFYFMLKKEVSPPSLKQMLGKVRHCFELCQRSLMGLSCTCYRAHVRKDFSPVEVSSSDIPYLFVSTGSYVRCIEVERIQPTAGFYFVCGLLNNKVLDVVQPVLCNYNGKCRYGSFCLYIHADVNAEEKITMSASMPLKSWIKAEKDVTEFVNHLSEIGLNKVGDVQDLSGNAFDALVSRESRWRSQWFNISVIRDIQPKYSVEGTLATFPDISIPPGSLPPSLTTISSLLALSSKEFYALGLPLKVQAACEKIRSRFEPDRNYNIIDLKKEEEGSFFNVVTPIVESFRENNTHVSWRKKDPSRPVVTSLMTYVYGACDCHVNVDDLNRSTQHQYPIANAGVSNHSITSRSSCGKDKMESKDERLQELPKPEKSWCSCPRFYQVAVNYELSTPSGSRCSEQNVLGKLASLGIPTSAVREVFVHGENKGSSKDPNPLFPCGVCENMLRKVNHDVYEAHGGDVLLYMFDSTANPKKLVYLPIAEISHRDGKGFKKFMADVREE